MVICAGHNTHLHNVTWIATFSLRSQAHGGPAGSHHPRLAARQPIHQTFNRQPRLFRSRIGEDW